MLSRLSQPSDPGESLPFEVMDALASVGADLLLGAAKQLVSSDAGRSWVVPNRDGHGVTLVAIDHQGSVAGGTTTVENIDLRGAAMLEVPRTDGWTYFLLVSDDYDHVRGGGVSVPVVRNGAVLWVQERLDEIYLEGIKGTRLVEVR